MSAVDLDFDIEVVSDKKYRKAMRRFQDLYPYYGWGLDTKTRGARYFIPELYCYFTVGDLGLEGTKPAGLRACELRGVFQFPEGKEEGVSTSTVILHALKRAGFTEVYLDCYDKVRHIWERAGFRTYKIRGWDTALAPKHWHEAYGEQHVYYMRWCKNMQN